MLLKFLFCFVSDTMKHIRFNVALKFPIFFSSLFPRTILRWLFAFFTWIFIVICCSLVLKTLNNCNQFQSTIFHIQHNRIVILHFDKFIFIVNQYRVPHCKNASKKKTIFTIKWVYLYQTEIVTKKVYV